MKKTIEIDAPPERVWQVMVDVERWREWTASITSIERLDTGPFAVGSRARVLQPKLRPAVWTVTQLEPGRNFTWTSGIPGVRVIGGHAVERAGQGSRAVLSVEFKGLFGGLVARVMRKLNDEYVGMEAAGLKRRCEGKEI
jgi:uncharacterized membrane protein